MRSTPLRKESTERTCCTSTRISCMVRSRSGIRTAGTLLQLEAGIRSRRTSLTALASLATSSARLSASLRRPCATRSRRLGRSPAPGPRRFQVREQPRPQSASPPAVRPYRLRRRKGPRWQPQRACRRRRLRRDQKELPRLLPQHYKVRQLRRRGRSLRQSSKRRITASS